MKIKVIIERGEDLFSFYTEDNEINLNVNGQGDSVEKAKEDFLLALEELKMYYIDAKKDIPEITFEYQYDVSSFLNYYSKILSKSGLEKITGINQKQLWHYARGSRNPKKETVLKIQESLHKFAEEISQIKFIN